LLVCEEEATIVQHAFSFAEPFSVLEKAQAYAKAHSDFTLGYEADMDWIQFNDGSSWRAETGSRIYMITETEIDRDFNQ